MYLLLSDFWGGKKTDCSISWKLNSNDSDFRQVQIFNFLVIEKKKYVYYPLFKIGNVNHLWEIRCPKACVSNNSFV